MLNFSSLAGIRGYHYLSPKVNIKRYRTRGDFCSERYCNTCVLLAQVETEGLRRSIQNLGVLLTTSAVAHTSVATGEGLRHATTGQHHTITVTTKDKVLTLRLFSLMCCNT